MGLPVEVNSLMMNGETGYRIQRSVRFRSGSTPYFARTPSVAGNSQKWTWSGWVKRGEVALTGNYYFFACSPDSLNRSLIGFNGNGGSNQTLQVVLAIANAYQNIETTAVFRDPTAWYHIVVAADTTLATAADRVKIYVNGVQQAVTGTVTQNTSYFFNTANLHRIGNETYTTTLPFDGYLAEVNWIDGTQLAASSFGQTNVATGVWVPKKYAGTTASYGTNGFYLSFTDNSTANNLGLDNSGKGNNWTATNISVTAGVTYDSMIDSPTPFDDGLYGVGNYCVFNYVNPQGTASAYGNAGLAFFSSTIGDAAVGTFAMSSGKWYWEGQTSAGTTQAQVTVIGSNNTPATTYSMAANNTVYGFQFDADAGVFSYTTNGTTFTNVATGLTNLPYFVYFTNQGTTAKTIYANFGQRPFTYSVPAGASAMNTFELQQPSIPLPAKFMANYSYTGTSANTSYNNTIAMSPNLVWIKARSTTTTHGLFDTVRGATRYLAADAASTEVTSANSLTAFTARGFTLDVDTNFNNSTASYMGWQWKSGTIPGFDIVSYTGTGANRTISHSLGSAPNVMIVKSRGSAVSWAVYHSSLAATQVLRLDTNAAVATDATVWNSTAPTNAVFSVGTSTTTNANTITYIAYLWTEIPGFSRFSSYAGNGLADGPFVWCGFKPAFVMIKGISATGAWLMYDDARNPQNLVNLTISADVVTAEATQAGTGGPIDFLANGFKVRGTGAAANTSGNTYVFMAFADSTFKYSRAV